MTFLLSQPPQLRATAPDSNWPNHNLFGLLTWFCLYKPQRAAHVLPVTLTSASWMACSLHRQLRMEEVRGGHPSRRGTSLSAAAAPCRSHCTWVTESEEWLSGAGGDLIVSPQSKFLSHSGVQSGLRSKPAVTVKMRTRATYAYELAQPTRHLSVRVRLSSCRADTQQEGIHAFARCGGTCILY